MTAPVFVDTSALLAVLDADDSHHSEAARTWQVLVDRATVERTAMLTHSGVVTETVALVQRRLGMKATDELLTHIVPILEVVWVDAVLHHTAATALLAAGHRHVSLVDWTSFVLMREHGIDEAFAFNDDFARHGFAAFTPS